MQINPLNSGSVIDSISPFKDDDKKKEKSFSQILSQSLENAKQTEKNNKEANIELLSGEDNSLHDTMIEAEKAELALELTIQIRNKVIDAYNEVMRMQV
jgi:flagellar hook-basal body complex protein FliE